MYLRHRARDHRRLPPPAHPPLLPDLEAGRVRLRRPRLDGRPGPGDLLGRRPPQAPRPHRRGGRPAQPARRPRRRRARRRSPASGTPTPAGCCRPRAGPTGSATRPTSTRTAACALINRHFASLVAAQPALPAARRLSSLSGTLAGAATGLLWGGLVRIFLVHHVTWSVNSVCHFFGTRRFETDDRVHATSSGSPCPRSASPGTTTTTPSRARPSTACAAGSSTPPALVIGAHGEARPGLERGAHLT